MSENITDLSLDAQHLTRRARHLVKAVEDAAEGLANNCAIEDREALNAIISFCEVAAESLSKLEDLGEQIEVRSRQLCVAA